MTKNTIHEEHTVTLQTFINFFISRQNFTIKTKNVEIKLTLIDIDTYKLEVKES